MYRSSSKLPPQWQRNPSPVYKRSYISRRNRVIFLITVCFIAWYRYSKPSLPDFTEPSRDSTFQASQPKWKTDVLSYPENERPVKDPSSQQPTQEVQQTDQAPPILLERDESQSEWPPLPGSHESDEEQKVFYPRISPEYSQDEDSPKEKISTPPSIGTPEYADDDTVPRNAAKKGIRKPDAADGQDISESIDQTPPQLVKQASENLMKQHLSPAPKYEGDIPAPSSQSTGPKRFPSYSEYAMLDEKAEALPDIIHTPFEVSTSDVVLEGWEDEWFANARLDVAKWGTIKEPKIDFVYTCKRWEMISSKKKKY